MVDEPWFIAKTTLWMLLDEVRDLSVRYMFCDGKVMCATSY